MAPRAKIPPHDADEQDSPYQNIISDDMDVHDTIGLLIAALHDSPENLELVPLALQFWLSVVQEHRDDLSAAGVTEQVVSIIQNHTHQEGIMELAMAFLSYHQKEYSGEENRVFDIHEAEGGIAAVVSAMRAFPDNECIQQSGVLVLMPLACKEALRETLIDQDAVPAIVSAAASLMAGSAPNVVGGGLTALAQLLESDSDSHVKNIVEDAGGIPVLVQFLEMYGPVTSGIVTDTLPFALECISLMADGKRDSVKAAFVELEGLQAIIKMMKCHILNGALQRQALNALHSLLADDKCIEAFLAAGGIATILAILKAHPSDDKIVGTGIVVFVRLTTKTAALADAVALHGGLKAVFEVMPRFVDDVLVQLFACSAIGSCVSYEDTLHVNDVILLNPGGIHSVVKALHSHPKHECLHQVAFAALADMTFSVNLCHNFVLSGGLIVAIKAMKQYPQKAELLYAAVRVVDNVARAASISKARQMNIEMLAPIYDSGLVPTLLGTVHTSSENDELVSLAISSLLVMAKNHDGIQEQIVSAGGVTVIASIEKKGGQATSEARFLLELLEDSENEENRSKVSRKSPS